MQAFTAPHSLPMHHDRTSCGAGLPAGLGALRWLVIFSSDGAGLSVCVIDAVNSLPMRAGPAYARA